MLEDDNIWRLVLCLVTKMLHLSANPAVILSPRSESGGVSEGSVHECNRLQFVRELWKKGQVVFFFHQCYNDS